MFGMFRNTNTSSHTQVVSNVPSELPDPNAVNTMAAKEMNNMSVKEREVIYEDIHGVSQLSKDEKPEFVGKCLHDLAIALGNIHDKPAFMIALTQNPAYAMGRDLLLMFLRSTSFDAKIAATKIVKYFEYKRIYFGDALLGRPVMFSDLGDIDVECLKCGWLQVLPFRDKAGRAVMWVVQKYQPKVNVVNLMRSMWYFLMLMMQDQETQKTGIVIASNHGSSSSMSNKLRESYWHGALIGTYFPFRIVSCHFCVKSAAIIPLLSLIMLGTDKGTRARTRIYTGTQTESMYALLTYGIPIDYAPITSGGNIKIKYYRQWLTRKIQLESLGVHHQLSDPSRNIIDLPRRNDILLGKGKLQQLYSGNQLFSQMIQDHIEVYSKAASRKDKIAIALKVWNDLQRENARFLERSHDECCWVQLTDEATILFKIAYQLRTKKPVGASSSSSRVGAASPYREEEQQSDEGHNGEDDDNNRASFLNQTESRGFSLPFCQPISAKRVKTM